MSVRSSAPKLAIEGGKPVRGSPLPYGRQSVEEQDIEAVATALRSEFLTTGPTVARFEAELATVVGARHVVTFSSGTAALHAAAFAAGLKPGDQAITTPLTFVASANCVLYQGATPVFADIQPDTLNLDSQAVEAHLSVASRAVIAVDYAGQPCDMDELMGLAEARSLVVIADAAHSLGATYKDRPIGSLAHMTTFSFHPVKAITTAEGGAVATGSAEYARRLQLFRNHGIAAHYRERERAATWLYEMAELGHNYRLSDLQCALGLSQLTRLAKVVQRRQEIAAAYHSAFSKLPGLVPPAVRTDRTSAWHIYPLRLDLDELRIDRRTVFEALRAENIGVNVHYIPVYWHPYYERLGYRRGLCPRAEAAYEALITLPLFPSMAEADFRDVVAAVTKVITVYAERAKTV